MDDNALKTLKLARGPVARARLPWLCALLLLQACGPPVSELGPDGYLGSHKVTASPSCVVKQTKIDQPAGGRETYSSICGDLRVDISGEQLFVNGKAYGRLNKGDSVHIERGQVFVNSKPVQEVPR